MRPLNKREKEDKDRDDNEPAPHRGVAGEHTALWADAESESDEVIYSDIDDPFEGIVDDATVPEAASYYDYEMTKSKAGREQLQAGLLFLAVLLFGKVRRTRSPASVTHGKQSRPKQRHPPPPPSV